MNPIKKAISAVKTLGQRVIGGAPPTLERIILPTAVDRWTGATLGNFDPARIETTIRGAMAGDLRAQWEMFDLMERTWPRLLGNLKKLRDTVTALEWELQAWSEEGEDPSDEALRRKKLLSRAIWNMDPDPCANENDFAGLVFDLTDAWGKGISIQEIDWVMQTQPDGGSLFVPRATWQVPVRFYGYPTEANRPDRLMLRANELAKWRPNSSRPPGADPSGWMEFPRDRFLIGVAKHKSGHPSASALLQALGFFWAASNFAWEWFLNYAQLFGVPMRWANYASAASPETVAKIEAMLTQMGSAAWSLFPEGTTMQILEGAKGGNDNPQAAIADRADTICDILILGQTLTTDAGDRGTQALGTVHKQVLTGRERALAQWVGKVLNRQLIPAFLRLNFGDANEAPYFCSEIEEEEDAKALAERDKLLLEAGAELPRRWFYERHGVPEPAEGEPVIKGRPAAAPMGALPGMPGAENPDAPDPSNPDPASKPKAPDSKDIGDGQSHDAGPSETMEARARAASVDQRRLADSVAESVTGVSAEWLGGARPFFLRLVAAARDPNLSDAEFVALVERAKREIPDTLAPLLKPEAISAALEAAMGASVVNGAVRGYLDRK